MRNFLLIFICFIVFVSLCGCQVSFKGKDIELESEMVQTFELDRIGFSKIWQMPDFATIELTQGKIAIVDVELLGFLHKWSWRAVRSKYKWYAKTTVHAKNRDYSLSMHRMVSKTPSGMICHHKNGNSLDNRLSNLQNMDRGKHELYHANNSLTIRRDPNYIIVSPASAPVY